MIYMINYKNQEGKNVIATREATSSEQAVSMVSGIRALNFITSNRGNEPVIDYEEISRLRVLSARAKVIKGLQSEARELEDRLQKIRITIDLIKKIKGDSGNDLQILDVVTKYREEDLHA